MTPAVVPGGGGHPVWHLLVVAAGSVAVFAGLKVQEWWRAYQGAPGRGSRTARGRAAGRGAPRPRSGPGSPLLIGVALASAGCALTHGAVGPAHFQEAAAFGVFFLVVSALQAGWALLVLRRATPLVLAAGAVGNAVVLALWAVTRTVGLPVGPEAWRPEAVAGADLFASLLEVAVVAGAACLLLRRPGRPGRRAAPLRDRVRSAQIRIMPPSTTSDAPLT